MIGAILLPVANNLYFYPKVAGRAIAEHAISAYVNAQQIQRIIIALPQSERKLTSNNHVQLSLLAKERMGSTKKIDFVFYSEDADLLSFLHQVATDYGLDHIVIGDINAGLMPAWLINEAVYTYFIYQKSITTYKKHDESSFNIAFQINIMPFWQLARMASHATARTLSDIDCEMLLINSGENKISNYQHNLIVTQMSDLDHLEFLYTEIMNGADISDVIEGFNDK